jgi:hypothetical protein
LLVGLGWRWRRQMRTAVGRGCRSSGPNRDLGAFGDAAALKPGTS